MTVGESLRFFRKKAGLTQEELAKKAGLATITIRQYETNKRTPNLTKLELLANALDIHSVDFFDEKEDTYDTDTLHLREEALKHYYDRPLNFPDSSLRLSRIIDICGQLNDSGQDVFIDVGEGLTQVDKYKRISEESGTSQPVASLDDV